MELNREQIIKALECFHQRILKTNLAEKVTESEIMAVINALSLIKELTEENERLRAENDELCDNIACLEFDNENAERRTVRKMQSEIEARCIKGGIYPAFVASTIDQIANELMEGENATN